MGYVVNINGKITPPEEATISVLDRGFILGDGIYETVKTYSGKPFLLDEHITRLERSASLIKMDLSRLPLSIKEEVNKTVLKAGEGDFIVRIIVTRGAGDLFSDPFTLTPNLVILVREPPSVPSDIHTAGVEIITSTVRRNPVQSLNPKIKTGSHLNEVLAALEAHEKGAFEALLLTINGKVGECSSSNIFIVKDNKVFTPPLPTGILDGITRHFTIQLARTSGVIIEETDFYPEELYSAHECFITSTVKEVMPVIGIDGKRIGDGSRGIITEKLQQLFFDKIQKHITQ
jgi:branched-chain amino acid aminotransferase